MLYPSYGINNSILGSLTMVDNQFRTTPLNSKSCHLKQYKDGETWGANTTSAGQKHISTTVHYHTEKYYPEWWQHQWSLGSRKVNIAPNFYQEKEKISKTFRNTIIYQTNNLTLSILIFLCFILKKNTDFLKFVHLISAGKNMSNTEEFKWTNNWSIAQSLDITCTGEGMSNAWTKRLPHLTFIWQACHWFMSPRLLKVLV